MGERLFITFALTGRSSGFYVTQGVALGLELAGPSAREGRPKNRTPHFASKVSYSASPHLSPPVPAMLLQCYRFAAEGNATSGRE